MGVEVWTVVAEGVVVGAEGGERGLDVQSEVMVETRVDDAMSLVHENEALQLRLYSPCKSYCAHPVSLLVSPNITLVAPYVFASKSLCCLASVRSRFASRRLRIICPSLCSERVISMEEDSRRKTGVLGLRY